MRLWIVVGIALFSLLLLLIIIMLSRIKIEVHAKKHNGEEEILLDIRLLFNWIKFHYEVPKIVFENMKKGFKVEGQATSSMPNKPKTEGEQNIGTELLQKWLDIYQMALESTFDIKNWFRRVLKHLQVVRFDWASFVALREADHTAVLAGGLWAVKSIIVGWLTYKVKLIRTPKLIIRPRFGTSPNFGTELTCIAQLRLGYAMFAGLVLIVHVLRVKGGLKKWRNILSKG